MDLKKASLYSTQLGFLPVLLPFSVSTRGICHGGRQTPRGCLGVMNRAKGLCPHILLSISFSVDVRHQRHGDTLQKGSAPLERCSHLRLKPPSPLERCKLSSALIGFSGIKKCSAIRCGFFSVLPISNLLPFTCIQVKKKKGSKTMHNCTQL